MFFISTSTSMARSRSETAASSEACGRLPLRGAGQRAELGDAGGRPLEEQHVAGQKDEVTFHVVDPVPVAADGHDPHAHLHRQLQVRQGPVGHLGVVPDPHPVGDLFGQGQVGHQGARDAQPVGHDAADVDRGVAEALDGPDDLEDRRHGVGVPGGTGGQHADGAHLVHQLGQAGLELVDLLGHGDVAEVDRRVAQVDHQLRSVLRLREHLFEISRFVVHGDP